MNILESALEYAKKGMSVIPVGHDKVPLIKWEPYQKKRASEEEIQIWFKKFPSANVGIVTGEVSNLLVVDCDTSEAIQKVQEAIPDSLIVPCELTPRGGMHFFFSHTAGFVNRARVSEGIDIRTSGGYCAVAPSVNGKGKGWEWVLSILDVDPPNIINSITSLLSFSLCRDGDKFEKEIEKDSFSHGSRNDTLFHIAYLLFKGGASFKEGTQITEIYSKFCDPPWGSIPEDLPLNLTIKSAFKRAEDRERPLADEVREFVVSSNGVFLSSDVVNSLGLSSRVAKKNVSKILNRMCDPEKIIEKYGNKNGSWRKIDRTINEQCWWESKGLPLQIRFPLEVEKFAKVFSGNIILLEGQKSQGKSSFALEFCRLNKRLFSEKPLYQNVEMSDDELTDRFTSYGDVMTPEEWREYITIIRQSGEWWDKIKPDALNIVDYLLEYKESYLIADFVWKIHQKLNKGIALVVVQRDPLKPYPAGGRGVRDIPRLVLSLIHHKIKIEDVKSFYITPEGNPSGMVRKYKQASWWKFVPASDWEKQEEEKYSAFMGVNK